jgi:MFS-type transporter involved in bile tolerance (Atg22 family)
MKKIIEAIKALLQLKKLLKSNDMNIETIQKLWLLIGALLTGLSFSWVPGWVQTLFGPEASQYVFTAFSAISALVQLLPFRKGSKADATNPAPLVVEKSATESLLYALIPIWPLRKAA